MICNNSSQAHLKVNKVHLVSDAVQRSLSCQARQVGPDETMRFISNGLEIDVVTAS